MHKTLIVLFVVLSFLILGGTVVAQEGSSRQELETKIKQYQEQLDKLRRQKNSLASEIQFMDTQINLTGLKITETEQKIVSTQKEIELLTKRIEGLDTSLDYLSKLLLKRVVANYKKQPVTFVDILLDSTNANELINRFKYQKAVQTNNEKLVLQVQETKLNFEDQKNLREKKKVQLDQLSDLLTQQKDALDSQKTQKQKLLADTNGEETTYQRLLQQAQRQLSAFKSYVQSSGASSVIGADSLGVGADGAYMSQRDARWASTLMGYSNENVLNVGCLISSIAMYSKKIGSSITPGDLASNPGNFWGSTALLINPWPSVAGKHYVAGVNIDNELANGNPVIVGVGISNCAYGGNHFVLLLRKDGDDYIMHDPVYGPDLKFSSHYSTICSSGTYR